MACFAFKAAQSATKQMPPPSSPDAVSGTIIGLAAAIPEKKAADDLKDEEKGKEAMVARCCKIHVIKESLSFNCTGRATCLLTSLCSVVHAIKVPILPHTAS